MELNQAQKVRRSGSMTSTSVKGRSRSTVQLSGTTMRKASGATKLPKLTLKASKKS